MVDAERGGNNGAERVGRLRLDYADNGQRTGSPEGEDNLPAVVLAGVIALLVMVGALLLILSGVFAQ